MARYNTPLARVNFVWHARQTGGTCTSFAGFCSDVFFATKAAGQAWTIVDLSAKGWVNGAQDQFQPALDVDPAGRVLIAYYTRSDDGNNNLYRAASIIISGDGSTLIRGEEFSSFQSDPNAAENGVFIQQGVIGDYHDVYMSGEYGRFQNVWTGRPGTDYDIFNYGLQ